MAGPNITNITRRDQRRRKKASAPPTTTTTTKDEERVPVRSRSASPARDRRTIEREYLPNPDLYKNKMTFFGLDTTISLWYILELIQNLPSIFKKQYPRFGYLYAFRLKKDLPVTKIIKTIYKNPKDSFHCRINKESVCIGPQVSIRGRFHTEMPDLYNISIELTLFYNHYNDYFELDKLNEELIEEGVYGAPYGVKRHLTESEKRNKMCEIYYTLR